MEIVGQAQGTSTEVDEWRLDVSWERIDLVKSRSELEVRRNANLSI